MGFKSRGKGLWLTLFVRGMQGEQPELAVWHLLYHVDTVILCLEGLRQVIGCVHLPKS